MSSFEAEQTFRNIIRYYANELIQVENGTKASVFFNENRRRTFTKLGVFIRVYYRRGCRLILSEKAKLILDQLNGLTSAPEI